MISVFNIFPRSLCRSGDAPEKRDCGDVWVECRCLGVVNPRLHPGLLLQGYWSLICLSVCSCSVMGSPPRSSLQGVLTLFSCS